MGILAALEKRLCKTGESALFPRGFLRCNDAVPAVETLRLGVAGTVVGVSEDEVVGRSGE